MANVASIAPDPLFYILQTKSNISVITGYREDQTKVIVCGDPNQLTYHAYALLVMDKQVALQNYAGPKGRLDYPSAVGSTLIPYAESGAHPTIEGALRTLCTTSATMMGNHWFVHFRPPGDFSIF